MYDVAICGLGRGGSLARMFPLFDDCRISAVCDLDEAILAEFGRRHPGVLCFTDYEEMLASSPDICVVASPVALHAEHSIAALHAGCHVLQEVYLD